MRFKLNLYCEIDVVFVSPFLNSHRVSIALFSKKKQEITRILIHNTTIINSIWHVEKWVKIVFMLLFVINLAWQCEIR